MTTRYSDIKSLLHSKCGFNEMILDNLSQDTSNTKKVTVGLPEEEDVAVLVRSSISGLFMDGQQLYVKAVQKKVTNQDEMYQQKIMSTYDMRQQLSNRPSDSNLTRIPCGESLQPTPQQPYYQQSTYQPPNFNVNSYQLGFSNVQPTTSTPSMVPPPMSFAGMFGGPTNQNVFANYGYPQQSGYQSTSQTVPQSFMNNYEQDAPLGFNKQDVNTSSVWSNNNNWNPAGVASAGNKTSQQSNSRSRWNQSDNSNSRPNRDVSSRDRERNASTRNYSRDASSRHFGRDSSRDRGRYSPSREFGRDASSRSRGRGASRERGRDAPPRSSRRSYRPRDRSYDGSRHDGSRHDYGSESRERRRDPSLTKNQYRAPPSKQEHIHSPFNIPPKTTTWQPKVFGKHVTDPFYKFSDQREGSKVYQPRAKPLLGNQWKNRNEPPAKRPRQDIKVEDQSQETGESTQGKKVAKPLTKKQKKTDPAAMAARAMTWRCQLASSIAREMINNPKFKNDIDPELFIIELKRAIRSRLEPMFADDHNVRMVDMLTVYREKYDPSTDEEFFYQITKEVKDSGTQLGEKEAAVKTEVKEEVQKASAPASSDPKKKDPPSGQAVDNMKQNIIFKDEETLIAKLQPETRKAMEEEIEKIVALVTDDLQEDKDIDPEETRLRMHACDSIVPDLKKVMTMNIARRTLNIHPIVLRVFNFPKMINKTKLFHALAPYGVSKVWKSEKSPSTLYLATCNTYDDHDSLCSMTPLVVDGNTITIKPFQLTGEKQKMTREMIKNARKTITDSFINADYKLTASDEDTKPVIKTEANDDTVNDAVDDDTELDDWEQESDFSDVSDFGDGYDHLISQLEPEVQDAVAEEIEEVMKPVTEDFIDEPESDPELDPENKIIHEQIASTVLSNIEKAITANTARRMLNTQPIVLRIYTTPDHVSEDKLTPALTEVGVTKLWLSDKQLTPMYYGTCETYDDLDKLCLMEPLVVDGSTVIIKPYLKKNIKEEKNQDDSSEINEDIEVVPEEDEAYDLTNENDDEEYADVKYIKEEQEDDDRQDDVNSIEDSDDPEYIENDDQVDIKPVKTEDNAENDQAPEITIKRENGDENCTPKQNIIHEADEGPTAEFIDCLVNQDSKPESELMDFTPEDLEHFGCRKDYDDVDDIDMADLDENDLEDW